MTASIALASAPVADALAGPIPVACSEGRASGGAEQAGLPALITRRCAHPPLHPGGRAWDVTYFDALTADLYSVGGTYGPYVGSTTARLRTRPHLEWESIGTVLNPTKWPKRTLGTGVFDPVGHRLVYYGGVTTADLFDHDAVVDDTLVLDVGNPNLFGWVPLAIEPPGPGRYWAQSIYDPVGNRMLVYGGRAWGSSVGNQTLVLNLAKDQEEWSALDVPVAPPGEMENIGHALAYDAMRHRAVLFGGGTAFGGPVAYGYVWVLDLIETNSGWHELLSVNPGPGPAVVGPEVFCSRGSGDCYLHAGSVFDPPSSYGTSPPVSYIDRVWRIRPLSDDTFEWTPIRTSAREGALPGAMIHWSSDLGLGYSIFGIDRSNEGNPLLYYSRETRVHALTEVEP